MPRKNRFIVGFLALILLGIILGACTQTNPSAAIESQPDSSLTPRDSAASRSPSQIYAILVGISDYPGRRRDLPHCDTDTQRIADSLQDRNLGSTSTIRLLTNRQATRTAVREAFLELAPQVQEQDLFLFFYDGHGNKDILEMHSSTLTRSDLRSLLERVKRGRRLIVLDSCEAGGFASAIRHLPNTAGLFAVRRGEEASTASEHEAGGYIAYHFWQGIIHQETTTSSSLFRTIIEGYEVDRTPQHPVLAGDRDLPLW